MSEHFGKKVNSKNLIQLEEGPSLKNHVVLNRYAHHYLNNPMEILEKSQMFNSFEGAPLGGALDYSLVNGTNAPTVPGKIKDIHPCEEEDMDNTKIEHLDGESESEGNEESETISEKGYMNNTTCMSNFCMIIILLLLIAIAVKYYCKQI
jgi:hypothetical protein